MANAILTPVAVTREALRVLHQKLNFVGSVTREYDDSFARQGAKVGDTLKVRLPNGQLIDGRVIFKAPEGDFATQRDVNRQKRDIKTIVLKLKIDNAQKKYLPGMTAEVLVPASKLVAEK